MDITEVRIKLMDDPHDRLQAFCSITFDEAFVIRDLKIIQGSKGAFVAMPSRKLTDRCPRCHCKNSLRALYCSQCGVKLGDERAAKDDEGRAKLYADIAHPINSECREMIQHRVLDAFEEEIIRSKEPGYVCSYDDYGEDRFASVDESEEHEGVVRHYARGNQSHRIEPVAHSGPPQPHHEAPSRHHEPATAQRRRTASTDDSFGAGIV